MDMATNMVVGAAILAVLFFAIVGAYHVASLLYWRYWDARFDRLWEQQFRGTCFSRNGGKK